MSRFWFLSRFCLLKWRRRILWGFFWEDFLGGILWEKFFVYIGLSITLKILLRGFFQIFWHPLGTSIVEISAFWYLFLIFFPVTEPPGGFFSSNWYVQAVSVLIWMELEPISPLWVMISHPVLSSHKTSVFTMSTASVSKWLLAHYFSNIENVEQQNFWIHHNFYFILNLFEWINTYIYTYKDNK